jgi:predicted DNA-binding transcriptional regulator AlpA
MSDRTLLRLKPTAARVAISPSQAINIERHGSAEQVWESLQLLRVADVCRLLRISKPTLWRLRRANDFPEPTEVTDRVIAWRKSEVELWLRGRSAGQRGSARTRRALPVLGAANAFGVSDKAARYKR